MLRTLESAAAVSKHDSVQLPGGGVCALLQVKSSEFLDDHPEINRPSPNMKRLTLGRDPPGSLVQFSIPTPLRGLPWFSQCLIRRPRKF